MSVRHPRTKATRSHANQPLTVHKTASPGVEHRPRSSVPSIPLPFSKRESIFVNYAPLWMALTPSWAALACAIATQDAAARTAQRSRNALIRSNLVRRKCSFLLAVFFRRLPRSAVLSGFLKPLLSTLQSAQSTPTSLFMAGNLQGPVSHEPYESQSG